MKKNKKALSIILAIILTVIMSLIALYLIDYIIPFSKNVKWIENVSKAYYQAERWVEESLFYVKNNFWNNHTKNFISSKAVDDSLSIKGLWTLLPPAWQWNSDYSSDYNTIWVGNPIQLEIWGGKFRWNKVKFTFKIPDISMGVYWVNSWSTLEWWTWKIINWQLISSNWILNASWSQILANDITNKHLVNKILFNWTLSNDNWIAFSLWIDWNWNSKSFKTFYNINCWAWKSCILKMSVLKKLEVSNPSWWAKIPLPYLDWRISLNNWSNTIPLRYTQIHTEWKSYWFKKVLDTRLPQQTINEAFDFTVFQ